MHRFIEIFKFFNTLNTNEQECICQIILIGTKADLKDDAAALEELKAASGEDVTPVSVEEGRKLADSINAAAYCETSARTGEGVQAAFNEAMKVHFYFLKLWSLIHISPKASLLVDNQSKQSCCHII